MTAVIPDEAGWDTAPGLLDGAMELTLTAEDCDLRYWLNAVPMGTLRGYVDGHDPALVPGDHMRSGPLFEAIAKEYAFRALAEQKATQVLAYLVPIAPDIPSMEFYATQVLDECRHSMIFRRHLVTLGVPESELAATITKYAAPYEDSVLAPLEQRSLEIMRDDRDFIGGVVMMTVILEGALAPAAELSERKWRPLNPAASEIDKGAGIDEIRHLTVGADIARQYLRRHPEERDRVLELIQDGMGMWEYLPTHEMVLGREELFQEGMLANADLIGDYEIWPGRQLLDTTPDERHETAERWSEEMKATRLAYMGLPEAVG